MSAIHKNQSVDEIAAVISETLRKAGLNAVRSGGTAVSIYSDNQY